MEIRVKTQRDDSNGSGTVTDDSPVLGEHCQSSGMAYAVIIGRLVAINRSGICRVTFPGNPLGRPVLANALAPLSRHHIGASVAIMFELGDVTKPVVMGLLRLSANDGADGISREQNAPEPLVIASKSGIELRCGRASLTLTASGKISIRGEYVSSRSSGVNRIKGGSVQIN